MCNAQNHRFAVHQAKEATYISAEYKEYARNPDTHLYELIKMDGKIIQVLEEKDDGGTWLTLRVTQNSDYDSIWMVGYLLPDGESRLLVDDKVALYGMYGGVTSYETVMGDTITVPLLYADGVVIK